MKRKHHSNGNDDGNRIRKKPAGIAGCHCPTLTELPPEILAHVLSFAQPREEYQQWEWIDIIGGTCKKFLKLARGLAPEVRMFGLAADFGEK